MAGHRSPRYQYNNPCRKQNLAAVFTPLWRPLLWVDLERVSTYPSPEREFLGRDGRLDHPDEAGAADGLVRAGERLHRGAVRLADDALGRNFKMTKKGLKLEKLKSSQSVLR